MSAIRFETSPCWSCVCVYVRSMNKKIKKDSRNLAENIMSSRRLKRTYIRRECTSAHGIHFLTRKNEHKRASRTSIYETFSYPVCRHRNSFPDYLSVVEVKQEIKEVTVDYEILFTERKVELENRIRHGYAYSSHSV